MVPLVQTSFVPGWMITGPIVLIVILWAWAGTDRRGRR